MQGSVALPVHRAGSVQLAQWIAYISIVEWGGTMAASIRQPHPPTLHKGIDERSAPRLDGHCGTHDRATAFEEGRSSQAVAGLSGSRSRSGC